MRRLLAAIALSLAALAAALAACGSGGDPDGPAAARNNAGNPRPTPVAARKAEKLPNVVVIYSDDQDLSDFTPEFMPAELLEQTAVPTV